jgi:hypothetical protein
MAARPLPRRLMASNPVSAGGENGPASKGLAWSFRLCPRRSQLLHSSLNWFDLPGPRQRDPHSVLADMKGAVPVSAQGGYPIVFGKLRVI